MCPGLYFTLLQGFFPQGLLPRFHSHAYVLHMWFTFLYMYVSIILTQMLLPGLGTPSSRTLQLKFISLSVPSTLHPSRLYLATYQMKKRRHGAVRQVLNP